MQSKNDDSTVNGCFSGDGLPGLAKTAVSHMDCGHVQIWVSFCIFFFL